IGIMTLSQEADPQKILNHWVSSSRQAVILIEPIFTGSSQQLWNLATQKWEPLPADMALIQAQDLATVGHISVGPVPFPLSAQGRDGYCQLFVITPFSPDDSASTVADTQESARLTLENQRLTKELKELKEYRSTVGNLSGLQGIMGEILQLRSQFSS